jgi:hypothetical protein
MQFEEDFSNEVADFQDRICEAGMPEQDACDQVTDFSSALADEYILLTNGLYSSILASMYHLWERDIKDLCKHRIVFSGTTLADGRGDPVIDQKIQSYKYETIKSLLVFWGAQEAIFDQVNLLRLVANTAKHGAGPSAQELLNVSGEYYGKLALFGDLEIGELGNSEIGPFDVGDVERFAAALSTFWTELSEQISGI